MFKKILFVFLLLLLVAQIIIFYLVSSKAYAQTVSSTEAFLSSINVDLPPARVACRTGGSLSQIFVRTSHFESKGNAFFLDKANKEIAFLERAVVDNVDAANKTISADIYIKVPGVQRETLVDLLLKKKIVATQNAQVIFAAKVLFQDGKKDVYVYDGKDESNNPVSPTMFTRIRKVGNVVYKGKKYVTTEGIVKIRFPVPPKKVASDGSVVNVFENFPGYLVCTCKGCPIHDYDLTDLKDAFDKDLVDGIIKEANTEDDLYDEEI